MKRKRFSTEQIIRIFIEAQVGIAVKDLYRKYGISGRTFYNWPIEWGKVNETKMLIYRPALLGSRILCEQNRFS